MEKLNVAVPHRLGREEAKRRIQSHLVQTRQEFAHLVAQVKEDWQGDELNFTFLVVGQSISGKLLVEEQLVRIEVPLPWLLAQLSGSVKPLIEQRGRKLLSGPSTQA
jgi:hypothetical protein